jgi:hypothetical protein
MSVDLQELFDQAGRTAPPPRLDPESVLHTARQRRSRRRATVAVLGAAVASAVVVVALATVPGARGNHSVGPVSPTVHAIPPHVQTAVWYSMAEPRTRTALTVVDLSNDGEEPVAVSGLLIDRDPSGAVRIDGVLSGVVPADPTKTTISMAYLSKLERPSPAAVEVPAHRDLLVVLRVRPSSCATDRGVFAPSFSVRLRSASGVESTLVVVPSDEGTSQGWVGQAVDAACGRSASTG